MTTNDDTAAELARLRMELHGAQHALEEASRERVRASLRADAAERERDAATARVAALTKDRDDNVDELVNCLAEREDDRRQASDALGHLRIRAEIAETERAAARRECDALRAIVEGRTAPPTIREARQHSHVTRGAFVAVLGSSPAHLSARIATGLQRFDQRRADTLADALRPDAAPTDACETRRAVDCHGTVYAVTVTRREGNRPRWEILCPTAPHPAARHYLIPAEYITTADDALRRWAGRALHLLAPGEATTAEQLAAVTARVEAAKQENARLRAALREYTHACSHDGCESTATWHTAMRTKVCDAHKRDGGSIFMQEMSHADVLRSLDGVPR